MKDFDDENFNDDDGDFDFNEENFELTDEDRKAFEQERNRVDNLPVMLKAHELSELVQTICDTIDDEKDELHMKECMLGLVITLPAKIAGAEGGDLFSIRFDNATIIKLNARELLASTNMLRVNDAVDEKYIQLLRQEIEEFRVLFIEWVKTFDKQNDISDEWDIKNL